MNNPISQLLRKVGDISYEVYLTHEFFLLAIITMPILHTMRNSSLWILIPYLMGVFFLSYIVKSKISDPISGRIRARFN
jgi:peptidoglycan/LPS O-acetylase OafA/YrhL